MKRLLEHDSDTESEFDEIVSSSKTSVPLAGINVQDGTFQDGWCHSSKSDIDELDTTTFLSFDWENEEPYQKAVERYCKSFSFLLVVMNFLFVSN